MGHGCQCVMQSSRSAGAASPRRKRSNVACCVALCTIYYLPLLSPSLLHTVFPRQHNMPVRKADSDELPLDILVAARTTFSTFDRDNSGAIDSKELRLVRVHFPRLSRVRGPRCVRHAWNLPADAVCVQSGQGLCSGSPCASKQACSSLARRRHEFT